MENSLTTAREVFSFFQAPSATDPVVQWSVQWRTAREVRARLENEYQTSHVTCGINTVDT